MPPRYDIFIHRLPEGGPMKKRCIAFAASLSLLFVITSCTKTESAKSDMPHAVVTMRDGTTLSGTVVSTTATGMTLNPDSGGGTRDIPMKEVKSVVYADAAAAPVPGSASAPSAPAMSAKGDSEPREARVHPERDAI